MGMARIYFDEAGEYLRSISGLEFHQMRVSVLSIDTPL